MDSFGALMTLERRIRRDAIMMHIQNHGHHHGHVHDHSENSEGWSRYYRRLTLAAVVIAIAICSACLVVVRAGQAVVITSFGNPVRVLTEPGLAWKAPNPIESATSVDLRLRTTSTGLQDVGTKDGLRILVQAYVAWRVPPDAESIRQYLRAIHNNPDEAAGQLRSLVGSGLQVVASNFALDQLINTNRDAVEIRNFEDRLAALAANQSSATYGISVVGVGIERLSLPQATLDATIARMSAERDTVAAKRTAEGLRRAAEIRSDAERDARIVVAKAKSEAAAIEAQAQERAATITAKAYQRDPQLYTTLRSMNTLDSIVGPNTRLIVRTDAVPFKMLVESPTKSDTPR
jgi:modulator of FtsH protease HflC